MQLFLMLRSGNENLRRVDWTVQYRCSTSRDLRKDPRIIRRVGKVWLKCVNIIIVIYLFIKITLYNQQLSQLYRGRKRK